MLSNRQSSRVLPTAQTTKEQEREPQPTLAATTVIDVHAIIPDPTFNADDTIPSPPATGIQSLIVAMLERASGAYRSINVQFRLAGVERTNEPPLTRDQEAYS